MVKGAKEGKGPMIYPYVHLFDGHFHASCYYQSTKQTEGGEDFKGKKGMRRRGIHLGETT